MMKLYALQKAWRLACSASRTPLILQQEAYEASEVGLSAFFAELAELEASTRRVWCGIRRTFEHDYEHLPKWSVRMLWLSRHRLDGLSEDTIRLARSSICRCC